MITEAREMVKESAKFNLIRATKFSRSVSNLAFALGANAAVAEDEIDDLVLMMIDPTEGIVARSQKAGWLDFMKSRPKNSFSGTPIDRHECNVLGADAVRWIASHFNVSVPEAIQRGQTYFMNREIFYSLSKKHISFHNKPDVFYMFKVLFGT